MRPLFAAPLALFSSYGWAQQLVAVAPESDSSGLLVVAILAIVGGLVFLKIKKPELFAKILGRGLKLKSAAGAAFDKLEAAVEKSDVDDRLRDALKDVGRKLDRQEPTIEPKPGPVAAAGIEYERRRRLEADLAELRAAKEAATPEPSPAPEPAPAPATPSTPKFVNGQLVI